MTLRIALRALGRNKVRSFLTMLGVVIGVSSVICMVSIGQGARHSVQKQIESLGQTQLNVMPGASSSGAISFGAGSVQTLTPQDAVALARECPSAGPVTVIVRSRAQVVYQNVNWAPSTVQGCEMGFFEIRNWPLAEGEPWTEQDVRSAAQVCLIGQTVADKLFPGESPVGHTVRVKNLPFRIVGLLDKKGTNTWGSDQDDALFMPWTTVKKKIQGSAFNNVDQIIVAAASRTGVESLEQEMKDVLRAQHRIQKNARGDFEDDFTIRNMTEFANAMGSTTQIMTALLGAIASISLLVGGIGIMNIMLVSVTERTREIGLRMAVGARGRDILAQFIVEALALSGIGGIIGIALGAGGALAISSAFGWPAFMSIPTMLVAVAFSAGIGVVFGFYPALRASWLDPIEALRYE